MGLVYTSAINFNDEPIYAKLHSLSESLVPVVSDNALETSTSTWGSLGAYISMLRDAGPMNVSVRTLPSTATWYFAPESSSLAKQV